MTVRTTLLTPPLQHAGWHYSGTVCQSALLAFRNTRRLCSCTCFKMFFSRYLNTATQKYTCKHREKYKHKFLNKPSYHTIQCKCACVCVCSVYVCGWYVHTYVRVCACVHLHSYSCPGDKGARMLTAASNTWVCGACKWNATHHDSQKWSNLNDPSQRLLTR